MRVVAVSQDCGSEIMTLEVENSKANNLPPLIEIDLGECVKFSGTVGATIQVALQQLHSPNGADTALLAEIGRRISPRAGYISRKRRRSVRWPRICGGLRRRAGPTGKSPKICPAPSRKIFRFRRRANQRYQLAPSLPMEGRLAIVMNAGWDAVDAAVRVTSAPMRTAKPCGPDAPTLASSFAGS